MSDLYVGVDYITEREEPAARQVAREAIAEYRAKSQRTIRRLRAWAMFLFGFAAGAWAAALLGGGW